MLDSLEVVGIAILAGYIIGRLFLKCKIPAVAGYVLIGIVLGQSVLDVFHEDMLLEVNVINDIALAIIAFIIGSELNWKHLKKIGLPVATIVIGESLGAFVLVFSAILTLFHSLPLALILGAIASATAPAATVMVIREMKASGTFTKTLLALVAIDDAIALLIYGFASSITKALVVPGSTMDFMHITLSSCKEIFGAIGIGVLSGILASYIIRKMPKKDHIYIIIVSIILTLTGLAIQLDISALLTNMAFGIIIANFIPIASKKVFTMLDELTPPLYIAFFVTAGAHLRIDLLFAVWPIAIVYLLARIAGKLIGAATGAQLSNSSPEVKKYIGLGLLSQVGVAIGLALVVVREFAPLGPAGKDLSIVIINILLGTTVVTEIVGPMLTKYALLKSGEANTLR